MKTIFLPQTDLHVSALGFGTTALGTVLQGDSTVRLIADFMAAGGNFFDTAHCYSFWEKNGMGASERELGRALRQLGCVDQVVIATKGGHPDAGAKYHRPVDYLAESVLHCDIESSLFRLGIDTIDLYYLHRDDGRTPVGEIIEGLNRFIRRGWLRYLGASNWSVERIAEANAYATAHGLQGFVASQIQGSLAMLNQKPTADPTHRCLDTETMAWHRQSKLPVVAFSATASGYFSDHPIPSAESLYGNPANQGRRERAIQLAAELGCTPTQIAFGYLLFASDPPIIPLFSTTRPAHLAEILASTMIDLSEQQRRWLEGGDSLE